MDSEDDTRSIDWAPNKINQLDEQIGRISENMTEKIDLLTDRVFDLERRREEADRTIEGTDKAVARLNDRISVLERFMSGDVDSADELTQTVIFLRRFNEVEASITELKKAMADHASETVKAVWSDTVRQLDEDEYSPPIGEGTGISFDDLIDGIPDVHGRPHPDTPPIDSRYPVKTEAERRGGLFSAGNEVDEAYRRGMIAGADKALDNAARRLRQKMATEGWAPHFVNGLAKLVRGFGPENIENPEMEADRHWARGHTAALDEAESRVVAALDKIDMFGRYRDEILSALRGFERNSKNGVQ